MTDKLEVQINVIAAGAIRGFKAVADGAKKVVVDLAKIGPAGKASLGQVATSADTASSKFDLLSGRSVKLGAALGTAVGSLAKVGGMAVEQERQVDGLTRAYGDAAAEIIAFAGEVQGATIFSDEDAREALRIMATLQQQYGLTTEQVKELTTVTADLASVTGMSLSDAAQRTSGAIRGETESAEALGLALNQQAIDREGLTLTMTNQEAAQFRLAALMEQAAYAEGAAGDRAETAAGQMIQLGNAAQDAATGFGQFLGPVAGAAAPLADMALALPLVMGGMGGVASKAATATKAIQGNATAMKALGAAMPVGAGIGLAGILAGALVIGHQKATAAAEDQQAAYQELNDIIRGLESSAARVDLRAISEGLGGDNGTQNPIEGLFGAPQDVERLTEEYNRLVEARAAALTSEGFEPTNAWMTARAEMIDYRISAEEAAEAERDVGAGAVAAAADAEVYTAAMAELYSWHLKNWLSGPDMAEMFDQVRQGMEYTGPAAEKVRALWVDLFEEISAGGLTADQTAARIAAMTTNQDELGEMLEDNLPIIREITAAEQERATALGWMTTAAQEATVAQKELLREQSREQALKGGTGRSLGAGPTTIDAVEGGATSLPQAQSRDEIISDRALQAEERSLERLAEAAGFSATEARRAYRLIVDEGMSAADAVVQVNDEIAASFQDMAGGVQGAIGAVQSLADSQIDAAENVEQRAVSAADAQADATIAAAERQGEQRVATLQAAGEAEIDAAQSAATSQIEQAEAAADAQIAAAEAAADAQIEAAKAAEDRQVASAESAADAQVESAQKAADAQVAQAERQQEAVTDAAKAQEDAIVSAAQAAHEARVDEADAAAEAEINAARRSTDQQMFELERLTAARQRAATEQTGEALQAANDASFKRIQAAETKFGAGTAGYNKVVGGEANKLAKAQEQAYAKEASAQEAALRQEESGQQRIAATEESRIASANARKESATEASAARLEQIEEQAAAQSVARIESAAAHTERVRTESAANVQRVEEASAQRVEQVRVAAAARTAAVEEGISLQLEQTKAAAAAHTEAVRAQAALNVAATEEAVAVRIQAAEARTQIAIAAAEAKREAAHTTAAVKREVAVKRIEMVEKQSIADIVNYAIERQPELAPLLDDLGVIDQGATGDIKIIIGEETLQNMKIIDDFYARNDLRPSSAQSRTIGGNTVTPARGHGGLVGYGHGGLTAANGRVVTVGEWGREQVILPGGSLVRPNPASEASMGAGGGGGITLVFNGDVYGLDDFKGQVGRAAAEALGRALPQALTDRRQSLGG